MPRETAAVTARPGADPPPLLMDAAGAAALCAVSRATWFQWQAAGLIPPPVLRRGRVVRWARMEIAAWVGAGCPSADVWRTIRAEREGFGGGRLTRGSSHG